uniref:Uncharacterized protein n=1 Tax=Romanomermis culicivorax TaxID=13658 RepID=A0A915KJ50_ROMCU
MPKSAATRPIIYNNIVLLFCGESAKIQRPSSGNLLDISQQRERSSMQCTHLLLLSEFQNP